MSTPFVGMLSLVGFNFAPVNWSFCNGALQSIAENDTLFALIGTTYGGDGQSTFALPDLRGRTTVHQSNSYVIGQLNGFENVTINGNTLARHTHPLLASSAGANGSNPAGAVFGATGQNKAYSDQVPGATMNAGMVSQVGGNLPHSNIQPFLACNWIIALFGIFPQRG